MNICGVISEYNPFHNGHIFHMAQTKDKLNIPIVCIMSGHFTQRGECSILDKWTRAKWALDGGANLVIELPVCYSTQSANRFSKGAINILKGLGVITHLSFGCETDNLEDLLQIVKASKSETYNLELKNQLHSGITFAKANELALKKCNVNSDIANKSNSILALEYLKEIETSNITPFIVKRTLNKHCDKNLYNNITSATSIRNALQNNSYNFENSVSTQTYNDLTNKTICFIENFEKIILKDIITKGPEYIKTIHDVKEGLENKLYSSAKFCKTYEQLITNVKSKRYIRTRIQRILTNILLDISQEYIYKLDNENCPSYARILGFDDIGAGILKTIKQNSTIPIITKFADYTPTDIYKNIYNKDILATQIYSLFSDISPNADFNTPIVIKKRT